MQKKKIEFGVGMPKVCIPIVGHTKEEILVQAAELADLEFDVAELRIDYFEQVFETDAVLHMLKEVRNRLDKPLLFTFRTSNEGGEKSIGKEEYKRLYNAVITSGDVELIDLELFFDENVIIDLKENAHKEGVLVVMSNHDFHNTPGKAEIIRRLCRMQQLGADLAKIAVMPNSKRDVLTLMDATLEMQEKHSETPVITMSMGKLGVVSRLSGALTGSAMTFATKEHASAPGQIPVEQMKKILEVIG